jgi:hypothetical protein
MAKGALFLRFNPFHAIGDRRSPSQIAVLEPQATNGHHFSFENFVDF